MILEKGHQCHWGLMNGLAALHFYQGRVFFFFKEYESMILVKRYL